MDDRIWVNFNTGSANRHDDGRLVRYHSLETKGSRQDIERLGIQLSEGLQLHVWMEADDPDGRRGCLIADGKAVHRCGFGWVVELDGRTIERVSTTFDSIHMERLIDWSLGMICARCGEHTGDNHQGHASNFCKKVGRMADEWHFCCPSLPCELNDDSRGG